MLVAEWPMSARIWGRNRFHSAVLKDVLVVFFLLRRRSVSFR